MSAFSLNQFKHILGDQIHKNPAEISPDAKLVDHLGIDSITLVNIVARLSETYDVVFSDIDFDDVETVEQIYDSLIKAIDED